MFWAVLTAFVLAPAPTWGQTTPNDTVKNESTALKELKDVVVRGKLPQTRLKGDALNTRIAGSPLQNAGTAKEVLAKIPGMVKKGEDLAFSFLMMMIHSRVILVGRQRNM